MEKVYVTNNEFDRSGNDCITNLFAGLIGLPILFLVIVWVFAGCDSIGF
jgi:hypothetical protein